MFAFYSGWSSKIFLMVIEDITGCMINKDCTTAELFDWRFLAPSMAQTTLSRRHILVTWYVITKVCIFIGKITLYFRKIKCNRWFNTFFLGFANRQAAHQHFVHNEVVEMVGTTICCHFFLREKKPFGWWGFPRIIRMRSKLTWLHRQCHFKNSCWARSRLKLVHSKMLCSTRVLWISAPEL